MPINATGTYNFGNAGPSSVPLSDKLPTSLHRHFQNLISDAEQGRMSDRPLADRVPEYLRDYFAAKYEKDVLPYLVEDAQQCVLSDRMPPHLKLKKKIEY